MKLIFLGSSSAFCIGNNNYQSNILLTDGKQESLLIDCGTDARHSLHEQGYSNKDISDVYISHLHADHMGGLEWLGFTSMFDPTQKKPTLHVSDKIVEPLWDNCLSGTMHSIEGEVSSLSSFFNVNTIKRNDHFIWKKIKFQLIQTVHVMSGFSLTGCHGLFFEINGTKIYFTADTQFSPHLLSVFYDKADIIFHDCETTSFSSGVHPQYDELKTLDKHIKAKIWLYHYNPGPLPNARKDGFLGFIEKGQSFEF